MVALGLSRQAVADRMGVSRPRVSAMLLRSRDSTVRSLASMADALGCDLDIRLVPRKETP